MVSFVIPKVLSCDIDVIRKSELSCRVYCSGDINLLNHQKLAHSYALIWSLGVRVSKCIMDG